MNIFHRINKQVIIGNNNNMLSATLTNPGHIHTHTHSVQIQMNVYFENQLVDIPSDKNRMRTNVAQNIQVKDNDDKNKN